MKEKIESPLATIEVVPTGDTGISWDEIWAFIQRFYEAERDYVEELIRHHGSVALFRAPDDGRLVGLTAMDVYPTDFEGRKVAVIFTSHVMLDEAFRGHNLLQRLGWRTFLKTRKRYPFLPIYWFFDSFGYRSYLLLPRNFRDFWPRHDRATPAWELGLMDHLAREMYRDAWQPELGVVRHSGHKRLRPGAPPPADASDPDLAFYLRANPGHAEGDMLVCLCPLSIANLVTLWKRARARARRKAARA